MINSLLALVISITTPLHAAVKATIYSDKFIGKQMADGEIYHPNRFVVASNEYPLGTKLRITNLLNGKIIYVIVQDRMAKSKRRAIDLSKSAAKALGITHRRGWSWVTVAPVI